MFLLLCQCRFVRCVSVVLSVVSVSVANLSKQLLTAKCNQHHLLLTVNAEANMIAVYDTLSRILKSEDRAKNLAAQAWEVKCIANVGVVAATLSSWLVADFRVANSLAYGKIPTSFEWVEPPMDFILPDTIVAGLRVAFST